MDQSDCPFVRQDANKSGSLYQTTIYTDPEAEARQASDEKCRVLTSQPAEESYHGRRWLSEEELLSRENELQARYRKPLLKRPSFKSVTIKHLEETMTIAFHCDPHPMEAWEMDSRKDGALLDAWIGKDSKQVTQEGRSLPISE